MIHKNKQAFTLVELIVVITILAILGTIAFISLQGYSEQARDSTRISDLSTMKISLELFNLDAGKYPTTTDGFQVTYSGSEIWTQGEFGSTTTTSVDRLDEIPLDPLTEKKYTYSTTINRQEFQLAGLVEGSDLGLYNGLLNQTNAGDTVATAIVTGNYNGMMLKTSTGGINCAILSLPSIISNKDNSVTDVLDILTNSGLVYNGYNNLPGNYIGSKYKVDEGFEFTGINLVAYSDTTSCTELYNADDNTARISLITGLQTAYTGTIIANEGIINTITTVTDNAAIIALGSTLVNNNLGGNIINNSNLGGDGATEFILTPLECNNTGWLWVEPIYDVYIGSSQGNGFCVSPRYGDWNSDSILGNGGISWNGWGSNTGDIYNGWSNSGIEDTLNISSLGQTRSLNSEVSYECVVLGSADFDFDTTNGNGDTIFNRMKWLATTGNDYNEVSGSNNIDWIRGLSTHTVGTYPQAIPALYIADCIDGRKDLGTTMTYTNSGSLSEQITYAQYKVDESLVNPDNANLTDSIYQDRQKYLTAWTQKKGSHLPSNFSYISNGTPGGCESTSCNTIVGVSRGEYQVACEAGLLPGTNDQTDAEWIHLSSIGYFTGTFRGETSRIIGASGCGVQTVVNTGSHNYNISARFIVRP